MKILKKIFVIAFTILIITSISVFTLAEANNTVVDMMDRKVTLPANVDRIITTYTPASQFVVALSAEEKLVAGADHMNNQRLFTIMDTGLGKLASVGSKRKGINIEAVVAADPDLVIMFPHNKGPQIAEKLKKLDISTIVINPESFEQIRETNLLIGKSLGLKKKAEKINEDYRKIIELVQRAREVAYNKRKRVYFANTQLLNTVGEGMLQTDLIEMAGGVNPAKEVKKGFVETSAEQLVKWDPDVVIVSQFYQGNVEKLTKAEKYKSISAFKNKNIYRIPSRLEPWDFPGPSSPLMVIWLSNKLYPNLYKDVDIKKIVNDFYQSLYGKTYHEFISQIE